ncbi:hypothetical protein Poli38472_006962 [Pythium oligandrum]|uniref:RWP-RK domain-containing protein n=1 Tax=Pythium oligandrum TaxID=41045 RepID=A0A8K1FGL2_PYTOL|nr:hypothetical protein Poli38472_006962 [Pythium oligandrum]|eukprot:TMW58817.1 hypothetical protein Poli38472_006962 [Pythium oligandrum]
MLPVTSPTSAEELVTMCPMRKPRKSRRVYDFSVETLLQYSYLRQDQAARALGVAPITLKRICQRHKIRWPYRAVKAEARRVAAIRSHTCSHSEQPDATQYDHQIEHAHSRVVLPPLHLPSRRVKLPSLVEKFGIHAPRHQPYKSDRHDYNPPDHELAFAMTELIPIARTPLECMEPSISLISSHDLLPHSPTLGQFRQLPLLEFDM